MEVLLFTLPLLAVIVGVFFINTKVTVSIGEERSLGGVVQYLLRHHGLDLLSLETLHCKHARIAKDKYTNYVIRTSIMRKDIDYYLFIVSSDSVTKKFEKITELRVRRALFAHKQEYFSAFGEFPNRQQIKELSEPRP